MQVFAAIGSYPLNHYAQFPIHLADRQPGVFNTNTVVTYEYEVGWAHFYFRTNLPVSIMVLSRSLGANWSFKHLLVIIFFNWHFWSILTIFKWGNIDAYTIFQTQSNWSRYCEAEEETVSHLLEQGLMLGKLRAELIDTYYWLYHSKGHCRRIQPQTNHKFRAQVQAIGTLINNT